jgi:O-antigen ligase
MNRMLTLDNFSKFCFFSFLAICAVGVMNSSLLIHLSLIPLIVFSILNFFKSNFEIKISKSTKFLFIFTFVALVGIFLSDFTTNPLPRLKDLLLIGIFPLLLILNSKIELSSKDYKILKAIFVIFVLFGTLSGVIGIVSRYTGFHPVTHLPVCHVFRNCGMYGMYMNYAHNLLLFLILLFGFFIRSMLKRKQNYYLIPFLLINLYFFYTAYTRGVWLGFLLAFPFYFIGNFSKKYLVIVLLVTLAFITGGLLKEDIRQTFISRAASNQERLLMWKTAIATTYDHPIIGIGLNNFESNSYSLKEKYGYNQTNFNGHAHNNFLEVLVGTGVVGFVFYLLWLLSWGYEILQKDKSYSMIYFPLFIAFIVAGSTQSTIVLAPNVFFVMMIYYLSELEIKKQSI